MNFLENIWKRLEENAERPVLQEVRNGQVASATGRQLLTAIAQARSFLRHTGLRKADRCVLLAPNSIRWTALDLAALAEGVIVVPLYARQAPTELAHMMKDCSPSLICCGTPALRDAVSNHWPESPRVFLLEEIFADPTQPGTENAQPSSLNDTDPVTIIYTSGTSGEPKGVVLNVGNLNHMLRCTTERLDLLLARRGQQERVFHYLPFCFAGSWILLLSCLSRNSVLTLSTDLTTLAEEIRLAAPEYFLNVPALLERVRTEIENQLAQRGGWTLRLFQNSKKAWFARQDGQTILCGILWLALARAVLFPTIRKRISPNLQALICGSAPLAKETQLFFMMLGVPVLQVYGLTETTAICTMDPPQQIEPGYVGSAIDGVEMKLGPEDEILVRGPNVFPGYWNRPQATAELIRDGWLHTGDLGEVNRNGLWRITGRIKHLIILSSGHNVAPEPLEEQLVRALPGAQQVVLCGNGRSFLVAIITGEVSRAQAQTRVGTFNSQQPHYKQIRAFYLQREPFTIEDGLLTANGKLKREAIAERFQEVLEDLYRSTAI
ncbi:MAG: AMP-binding protein [Acidobacteria bacterium]|nr:AMP-binding protein [Acidobacteriota bacterium]